jgi:hypothetical protein
VRFLLFRADFDPSHRSHYGRHIVNNRVTIVT